MELTEQPVHSMKDFPKLTEKFLKVEPEELMTLVRMREDLIESQLEVSRVKAEMEAKTYDANSTQFQLKRYLRALSQKYKLPLYDGTLDVDVITGQIKENKNARS